VYCVPTFSPNFVKIGFVVLLKPANKQTNTVKT